MQQKVTFWQQRSCYRFLVFCVTSNLSNCIQSRVFAEYILHGESALHWSKVGRQIHKFLYRTPSLVLSEPYGQTAQGTFMKCEESTFMSLTKVKGTINGKKSIHFSWIFLFIHSFQSIVQKQELQQQSHKRLYVRKFNGIDDSLYKPSMHSAVKWNLDRKCMYFLPLFSIASQIMTDSRYNFCQNFTVECILGYNNFSVRMRLVFSMALKNITLLFSFRQLVKDARF